MKRMDLSEYERMIAEEVLDPEQLEGGFDTIGGLEQAKREVCARGRERGKEGLDLIKIDVASSTETSIRSRTLNVHPPTIQSTDL